MKRFTITIRTRHHRWTLHAIAKSSCDALCAVLDSIGPGCFVSVKAV